jgi:hypothetical protein
MPKSKAIWLVLFQFALTIIPSIETHVGAADWRWNLSSNEIAALSLPAALALARLTQQGKAVERSALHCSRIAATEISVRTSDPKWKI